jgi:hypothetical protein
MDMEEQMLLTVQFGLGCLMPQVVIGRKSQLN